MKKIFEIVANTTMSQTEKVIAVIREFAVIYAKKGKQATLDAYEKFMHKQTVFYKPETLIILSCLEDLYLRGNLDFVEAVFAEEDVLKLYNYEYRSQFLPSKRYTFKEKAFQKWQSIEKIEAFIAGIWVYYKLPFLPELTEQIIHDMKENETYLEVAEDTKTYFLQLVAEDLGWTDTPNFLDCVVENLCNCFMGVPLDDYGIDNESFEAEVWYAFCQEPYGLIHLLTCDYKAFTLEVARNMLRKCA